MSKYETDEKGVTRKDGKIGDTIPTYMWTKFVGGNFDGQEIIGRDLEKREVSFGEEEGCTYARRLRVVSGLRIIAFVDIHHPKSLFWPYEVMREMAKTHHHLMTTDYNKAREVKKGE